MGGVRVVVTLAEPEPGAGERVSPVVVCVTENVAVELAEVFEKRNAAFAGQGGDVGEGEGELLLDFEEGHGWRG